MRVRASCHSVLLAGLTLICGCSGPSSTPSPIPIPGPTFETTVRIVSALSPQFGLPQVTVVTTGRPDQQTDANGMLVIQTDSPATMPLLLRHSAFVERETSVRIPYDGTVTLSLIPATHGMSAFEEFTPRAGGLQRWTGNPRLMVLNHVVDFSGATSGFLEYPVIDRPIAQAQLDCLAAGVASALADMGGGHLSWTSIDFATVEPGSRFRTDQTPEGTIVVLPSITLGAAGRGTAYIGAQPSVFTRGAVWMGVESQNFCLISLLYRHELGHALGYLHVTRTLSIMGLGLPPGLTDFDRNSVSIAFQRPPGNRSPDRDPSGLTVNLAGTAARRGAEPLR